ncbi:MAG: CehA/McbA family metallohydrolase, partial [Trueperaceae bacterium]
GQIAYAYIDGNCEGWLPRGRVLVDVARGYEYQPLRAWVTIEPDQRQLTLRLERWIDMNSERYYSGDTHVHFLSTQGALTEARAEDLNVVNLLLSQWGHLFTNSEEFTGYPFMDRERDTIVHASQENRQHILGHLSLLGLRQPVMPWASGGPGEAELGGGLDTTLSRWADAAHAQGATVIVPHLPTPNGEAAVLIATGRADAVEMLDFLEFEHLEYYRYLNGGYRLPLVGGTDKMSNQTPVGLYRTYVRLPEDQEFNYENWCAGLRAGRTFLSGGAMLWFTVEGQPIGETVTVAGGGPVEVEAVARSIFPLHTLQIVSQGRVVAESTDEQGTTRLRLKTRLEIEGDTWLAARCAGPDYTARPHYDARGRGIMAHSSPIYVTTGSEYRLLAPKTAQYMMTLISGGLSYIRHHSPQHPHGHTTHHHGLPDHIGYLEEPFREAMEAIHRRMHDLGIPH